MRPLKLAVLFLLLTTPAAFAEIKITGATNVPPYKLVRLTATGTDPKDGLSWRIHPHKGVDRASSVRGKLEFVAPPGEYEVFLSAYRNGTDGSIQVEDTQVTVTIGDPIPPPPPVPPVPPPPVPPVPPVPPPPVPPAPITRAWVVVIEESAEASADRGRWLADKGIRDYLTAKGWKLRVADKDVKDGSGNTPKDLQPYISRASGKKLPQIFVVDQDGKVRHEGDLPTSTADLLAVLKKIGG